MVQRQRRSQRPVPDVRASTCDMRMGQAQERTLALL
jgi:hypothetical protein